jgi:hypothetical protein
LGGVPTTVGVGVEVVKRNEQKKTTEDAARHVPTDHYQLQLVLLFILHFSLFIDLRSFCRTTKFFAKKKRRPDEKATPFFN